jgi:hypothetical protein
MGVKATLKYWHHFFSFGHVAIELRDTESDQTLYISWANGNSPVLDAHDFGQSPVEIELPEAITTFADVQARIMASPLYLSPDAVRYATAICLKQMDFIDVPLKYRRELTEYGKPYQMLSYNCAHAVEDILIWSGFIHERVDQYALRPYVLVQHVLSELRIERAYEKWLLYHDYRKLPDDKIKGYLSLILQHLEWKRVACLAERFPAAVKEIDADIALLKQLNFTSTKRVEDVMALTNLIGATHLTITAKQLRQALRMLPAQQRYQAQIEYATRILTEKAADLAKRGFVRESNVAFALANDITTYRQACFKDHALTVAEFKQHVAARLRSAEPVLSSHRGWKKVLTNLVLAVLGLGVGYLLAATCQKISSNRFFFFPRTDSKKCLELIERGLGLTAHPACGYDGMRRRK